MLMGDMRILLRKQLCAEALSKIGILSGYRKTKLVVNITIFQ
jgi:hypothetical protein